MRISFFLLFSIVFLFFGCKKEEENYIEDIKIIREYEGPAPDHLIFELNVSSDVYSKIDSDSLTRHILELNKNERIDYSNNFFGLDKVGNNKIIFHFITPYFLFGTNKRNNVSETLLIEEFRNSKDLRLILHFNKHVFEFKNK
ncbi:MAG: hypothetical protein ACOVNP_01345 [Flavobacterium sp.]